MSNSSVNKKEQIKRLEEECRQCGKNWINLGTRVCCGKRCNVLQKMKETTENM